jgi:hypothetical protein
METNIIIRDQARENVVELSIVQSIHEIRGVRVMLDFDLAKRYEVETRALNQSVKRNIRRFPGDFMFQLTKDEWESMSSQIVMTSRSKRPKSSLPYAFTREGVAMLSGVLHSEKAIDTNILIMRAFVAVQQYALNYAELKRELDAYMEKTDGKIDDIYKILDALVSHKKELEKPRNPIGFRQNRENLINT